MCKFNVDADIKKEFLSEKVTNTAKLNQFVLKQVDSFESIIEKEVYNMSYKELEELLTMQFNNFSLGVVTSNVSIIRRYVDFCLSKNLIAHGENRMYLFTRERVKNLINQQAVKKRYINLETLRNYQNILENEQDVALLEAPFFGIKGRPESENSYEEIINLQINENNKNFQRNSLKLVRNDGYERFIEISETTKQILIDAKNQEIYVANNGFDSGTRGLKKSKISKIDDYVFRIPGKDRLFWSGFISARVDRIKKWLGDPFLSIDRLYMAGMIHKAKEIYKKVGSLDKYDYINICKQFHYGEDPEKYWNVLKDNVENYIDEW